MNHKIKKSFFLISLFFAYCLYADDSTSINLSISSNSQLAMNTNAYPVTPGDVYTLAYNVGTTAVSYSIPVDLTYKIRIANLGILNCSGMTYLQLKEAVTNLVQKNYPMSGVQFVLTTPATFLVSVSGEVLRTVEVSVNSLTRLSALVSQSSTSYSSIRNVSVISINGKKHDYDLFIAERYGDFSQNPYMRPGDKVYINRFERKVTINGSVERPGTYELLKGENLKELVYKYGGGLTDFANLSMIELIRYKDSEDKMIGAGVTTYLDKSSIGENNDLYNLDVVTIPSLTDIKNSIFLEGAVGVTQTTSLQGSNRITITFAEGENYASVIRKNSHYFSNVSDLANSYIIRKEISDNGAIVEKQIPIDISKILFDASYFSTETLKNLDILSVPFNQMFVNVTGAVISPGRYPYIAGRNWEYYIKAAGGFNEDMNSNKKIKITGPTGKKMTKEDIILPETTINARDNNTIYNWNKYQPSIMALITLISSSIALFTTIRGLN